MTSPSAEQRELTDLAPVLLWTARADGYVDYVNVAWLEHCGMTAEQVMGHGWIAAVHPDDIPATKRAWDEALRTGGRFEVEQRLRREDGGFTWFLARAVPRRGADGAVTRWHGANVDIDDRKRTLEEHDRVREQLAQAHKLDSLGRLAGGIAHDFNNMLGAILGNAELALEQVAPDSAVADDLREIQQAARHSAELTGQLLAFARKQPIAPKVLQPNAAIAEMLELVRRLVGDSMNIRFAPARESWPIRIDPTQFRQVLTNLCLNARDAGARNLTLTTEGRLVGDGEGVEAPGPYVVFTVRDDGSGMSDEAGEHLFEPFFTTKEDGRGTGLGLSMVHGIIKQNGGHIGVASRVGAGTTFTLYLPRCGEAPHEEPHRQTQPPQEKAIETILVVEDEPAVLNVTVRMLGAQGYRVLAASTPEQALLLAEQHVGKLHLLLTDVVMPGLNGRELAQRIAALHPELRCLFMSGYASTVVERQGLLAPGAPFLQKPFSRAEMTAQIRETLARPAGPLTA